MVDYNRRFQLILILILVQNNPIKIMKMFHWDVLFDPLFYLLVWKIREAYTAVIISHRGTEDYVGLE